MPPTNFSRCHGSTNGTPSLGGEIITQDALRKEIGTWKKRYQGFFNNKTLGVPWCLCALVAIFLAGEMDAPTVRGKAEGRLAVDMNGEIYYILILEEKNEYRG